MKNYSEGLTVALADSEESSWGIIDILTLLLVFFIILYVNELPDSPEAPGGLWSELSGIYEEGSVGGGEHTGQRIRSANPFAAPHPASLPAAAVAAVVAAGKPAENEANEANEPNRANRANRVNKAGDGAGLVEAGAASRESELAESHPAMVGASGQTAPSLAGIQAHFAGWQQPGFALSAAAESVTLILEESLSFASGSAELGPDSFAILDLLAGLLVKEPNWELQISGHSDDLPIKSERFSSNWYLSTARAVAVAEYLLATGLAPERVTPKGHAEFRPLYPNDSPENRARNRRVEITLQRQAALPAAPSQP